MAGASFKMDMGPLAGVCRRAVGRIRDTQNAAEEIGEALVSSTRERFEREETPSGEKWPQSQRAIAEGGQTLTDNAILKNSIGYEASGVMVAVGTAEEDYGAIHNFGGEAGPKDNRVEIPARPYIGISADDREEAREILLDHIRKAFS